MTRALGLLALLLVLGPAPATAQLGRKSWEFFPHVGVLLPGDPEFIDVPGFDDLLDPGTLWGFHATYHYSDHVGVEMGFSKGTANGPENDFATGASIDGVGGGPAGVFRLRDVGFDFWELNGFLNSNALSRTQLFATAGGGLVNYDPEGGGGVTRLLLDAGLGVRYYAWKNIAVRGEVKDYVFPGAERADYGFRCLAGDCEGFETDGDDTVHNIGVFAGLTFNF